MSYLTLDGKVRYPETGSCVRATLMCCFCHCQHPVVTPLQSLSFPKGSRHNFYPILFVVLAFLVGAGASGMAFAATFNVNSTFDVVAAPPLNNGVCETAPGNGICTLRAAIMKANHFPGGGVTINVPASALPYKLTTAPAGANDETTGDLNITAAMTIAGAGIGATIIDGNATDRVIKIQGLTGTINIAGVTIRNGMTSSIGGGIYIDGGTLMLSNSAITGSSAFHGGGICTLGNSIVTLSGVTISGNTSAFMGGGVYTDGVAGSTTINDSLIGNNTAGSYGGGLELIPAAVIHRSVVAGNRAAISGGGISADGVSLLIADSTINANRAETDGGGVRSGVVPVTIQNSTVSANSAGRNGGGIFQEGTPGVVRLFHVTVAGNVANSNQATPGSGGGLYRSVGSDTNEVWNSLLVENSAGGVINDCAGGLTTSQDYNYFQTLSGCTLNGTVTHNVPTGGDPWLDALQDNGGPTPTRALFNSSPALDQIPAVSCRDSLGAAPNPDQRGVVRPVGPQCDIGAYEGSKPALLLGRNLIRNGDAENGAGATSGAYVVAPNWTPIGSGFTVVPYGSPNGFPALTDVVPANHGYNFFAGGSAGVSIGRQSVSVASLSTAIDAGQVTYDMAGDFGGYFNQDDQAALSLVFRDPVNPIGSIHELGHVTATDRGNQTGLLHRSLSGAVPPGTRAIELSLVMTRFGGSGYNDGYADNLSLVLDQRHSADAAKRHLEKGSRGSGSIRSRIEHGSDQPKHRTAAGTCADDRVHLRQTHQRGNGDDHRRHRHRRRANLQRQRRKRHLVGCQQPAVRDGLAYQRCFSRWRQRRQRQRACRIPGRRREPEPGGDGRGSRPGERAIGAAGHGGELFEGRQRQRHADGGGQGHHQRQSDAQLAGAVRASGPRVSAVSRFRGQ